jgi:hypothetical protein
VADQRVQSAMGSSSSSSRGRLARVSASASWVRRPPDSCPTRRSGGSSNRSSQRSATAWSQPGLSRAPKRSISSTLKPEYSGLSWARRPTRASTSDRLAGGAPSTRTSPALGASSPTARCSRVVLPAPLGPTRATTRPSGIATEQSRSAQLRR